MKRLFAIAVSFFVLWPAAVRAEQLEAPPNLKITDQEGRSFPLYDLKGTPLFVSFVYSRCPMPNMCPLTMTLTRRLVEDLKKQKLTSKLNLLVVTLDPEHDTPADLKDLARRHRIDTRYVRLVTGQPDDLKAIETAMLVIGKRQGEFIAHNVRSVLLDGELTPVKDFEDNQWNSKKVISALHDLEKTKRDLASKK